VFVCKNTEKQQECGDYIQDQESGYLSEGKSLRSIVCHCTKEHRYD